MAAPVWAYQVDNFDPPPDEELICSVCRSVFCDPVQSPCNHVFCRGCINKWLESNRNCPICRKRTTKYSVQEVVPIVKNMIMKLTLYCHNKEKGCEEKFTLESCETHLKVCAYETVRCNNKPCKEMLMRKDLEDHELSNCLHRYIRCQNCCLKISSIGPTKHNCVKALKKRLREKNEMLKTKNRKIVELQEEIKTLKEAQPESSDLSSLESLSAGDVLINLPSTNDSFDSTSFASESDGGDDDSFQVTGFLSHQFDDFQENFIDNFNNEDDSIEYPRTSSPAARGNSVVNPLDSNFDDELHVRRPTKRRLPVRTLDSSEEENDRDVEPPPAPSPKRVSWCQIFGDCSQSSSQGGTDVPEASVAAQGSVENGHLPSLSTASCSYDGAQGSNSNMPFKLRPRVRRSNAEQASAAPLGPARRNSRGIFERTRALLEQYSLESDPEWLPPNSMDAEVDQSDSDSSFHPPVYPDDRFSTSSDSSLSDDSSSSDSSYVDAQSRTNMLCGLYSTSSSDDPDWIPP